MKGAIAVPWLRINIPPNKSKAISIGRSQYFFLNFKNSQNSFKNDILKLFFYFDKIFILKF